MTTKTVSIDGMSCGHCINRVRESLLSLPGVSSVRVSISDKLAVIELEEGSVSDEKIVESIERLSFDVTGIE